jgi:hypothetical protein
MTIDVAVAYAVIIVLITGALGVITVGMLLGGAGTHAHGHSERGHEVG